MMRFRPSGTVLVVASLFATSLHAQGRLNSRTLEPEVFEKVLSEWNSVDQQLNSVTKQLRTAAPSEVDSLRRRYTDLVDRANLIIPRLRVATIAEYRNRPEQDPEVTRTMLGLLANDVRSDHVDSAMEISAVLIQNNCEHRALYNLAGRTAFCAHDFESAEQLLGRAQELDAIEEEAAVYLQSLPEVRQRWRIEEQLRSREEIANDLPRVRLETSQGDIVLELFENEAPQTVGNFVHLVERGFYDGLLFHRVIANFMAQAGCPKGDGSGGPGYKIHDEVRNEEHRNHFRGSLSMAKTNEPDSAGSQFFITFRPTPHLDGKHTVFGRVVEGMEVLEKIRRRDPARSQVEADRIVHAEVVRKRNHEYRPTKVTTR